MCYRTGSPSSPVSRPQEHVSVAGYVALPAPALGNGAAWLQVQRGPAQAASHRALGIAVPPTVSPIPTPGFISFSLFMFFLFHCFIVPILG